MTRAAINARYSSSLQKATSIEDQVDMARRECDRQGWTVVAVFEDREMTGRNMRRPGLQRMKTAIADGEIDVVVVEALGRDRARRPGCRGSPGSRQFAFQGRPNG